jgi:hypothetical protein
MIVSILQSGCIGGGGQPISLDCDIVEKRMEGLYSIDHHAVVRRSLGNPDVKKVYSALLGSPGSATSHRMLHTHYTSKVSGRIWEKSEISEDKGDVLVLYGTQGGRTAVRAHEFTRIGRKMHIPVRCIPMETYNPVRDNTHKHTQVCLHIARSYRHPFDVFSHVRWAVHAMRMICRKTYEMRTLLRF